MLRNLLLAPKIKSSTPYTVAYSYADVATFITTCA